MERLMSDGYPFIFQMIDKSESDEYLIQTLQYRFKSDKSVSIQPLFWRFEQ